MNSVKNRIYITMAFVCVIAYATQIACINTSEITSAFSGFFKNFTKTDENKDKDVAKKNYTAEERNKIIAATYNACNVGGPFEFLGRRGNKQIDTTVDNVNVALSTLTAHATNGSSARLNQRGLTKEEAIKQGIERDKKHGATNKELLPDDVRAHLLERAAALGASQKEIQDIADYLNQNENTQEFYSLRYETPGLILRLDKAIKEKLDLNQMPAILDSVRELPGKNLVEIKKNFVTQVFTPDMLKLTSPKEKIEEAIAGKAEHLRPFASKTGQLARMTMYWLGEFQEALKISSIKEINAVKAHHEKTTGNSGLKGNIIKQQLLNKGVSLFFGQELDETMINRITGTGEYRLALGQNCADGTVVIFDPAVFTNVRAISFDRYSRVKNGALNGVLATHKPSGRLIFAVDAHTSSSSPEKDIQEQFKCIREKIDQLEKELGKEIFLVGGADTNIKKKNEIETSQKSANEHKFVMTSQKTTNEKTRGAVTTQLSKSFQKVEAPGDHCFARAGQAVLKDIQIGFAGQDSQGVKPKIHPTDPYKNELSDHLMRIVEVDFSQAVSSK